MADLQVTLSLLAREEPGDDGRRPMVRVYLRLPGDILALVAERRADLPGGWTLFPEALTGSTAGAPGLLWSVLHHEIERWLDEEDSHG